jgi:hypothetical protein
MGAAYYIVLEREIDGLDTMMDGKKLSRSIESLDAVAERLGVRQLSEFVSIPPEEVAEYLEDTEGLDLPPLKQFSAKDGLATVRALLAEPMLTFFRLHTSGAMRETGKWNRARPRRRPRPRNLRTWGTSVFHLPGLP